MRLVAGQSRERAQRDRVRDRGQHLLHAEAAAPQDLVEPEPRPTQLVDMPDEPGKSRCAPAHEGVELRRGIEPRLVRGDERDEPRAVRVALAAEPPVQGGESLDRLAGERGIVLRRRRHELPRERDERWLDRAGRPVGGVRQRVEGHAARGARVGARRWCGGGSRPAPGRAGACAARRAPRRGRGGEARSRASTSPTGTGPGTSTRRGSGSGTRSRRACARPPGFARTRCARRARRDVRTRWRRVGAGAGARAR